MFDKTKGTEKNKQQQKLESLINGLMSEINVFPPVHHVTKKDKLHHLSAWNQGNNQGFFLITV